MSITRSILHFPLEKKTSRVTQLLSELKLRGLDDNYYVYQENKWGLKLEGTTLTAVKTVEADHTRCSLYYNDILLCETQFRSLSIFFSPREQTTMFTKTYPLWGLPDNLIPSKPHYNTVPTHLKFLIGRKKPEDLQWQHLAYLGVTFDHLILENELYHLHLPTKLFAVELLKYEACIWHELYFKGNSVGGTSVSNNENHSKNETHLMIDANKIAATLKDFTILAKSPFACFKYLDQKIVQGTIEGCINIIATEDIKSFKLVPPGHGSGFYIEEAEKVAQAAGYEALTNEKIDALIDAMNKNHSLDELEFYLVEIPLRLFKKLTDYLQTRPGFKSLTLQGVFLLKKDYQAICSIRDELHTKFTIKIDVCNLLEAKRKKPDDMDGWKYLNYLKAHWPSLFKTQENSHWELFNELDAFIPKLGSSNK